MKYRLVCNENEQWWRLDIQTPDGIINIPLTKEQYCSLLKLKDARIH